MKRQLRKVVFISPIVEGNYLIKIYERIKYTNQNRSLQSRAGGLKSSLIFPRARSTHSHYFYGVLFTQTYTWSHIQVWCGKNIACLSVAYDE